MMNSRLKAFTILELIVVMILTSIIAGIVYMAIGIFNHQYRFFNGSATYMLQYHTCKQQITTDIRNCKTMTQAGDSLVLAGDTATTVYYFRGDSLIYRKGYEGTLDSFALHYSGLQWELIRFRSTDRTLVAGFNMSIRHNDEEYPWFFKKHYDEAILFGMDN
ncbi:type II secretion system protein [Chitinophaga flava]|uniref:Prepilin-type cleavage/methylation domain-containing protein n=1 Tax=Chitinophaga flava TaxID=2259036 RepID=A0A365XZF0_9BACT|nr:type II secretion system protein [Chitinophaga flava]RBL91727.1 hypothetical protein DF182_03725 [Chitinophaga flava]